MKETPEGSVSFCFDLQQVQTLPKIPISEAFYARQLSFYALSITSVDSKAPVFYHWTEDTAGRGSNEVASAVFNFLCAHQFDGEVTTVRLFADGCAGQNKNSTVVNFLYYWLLKCAPPSVKRILMVFPVRGHSYLPADRVFGRVEKLLRKQAEILLPEAYLDIYREVGECKMIGVDWEIQNFKSLEMYLKKIEGISQLKRIIFVKSIVNGHEVCKVKTEVTFRCDDTGKPFTSLLKRGKKTETLKATVIPVVELVHPIKEEKKRDVDMLLTKFTGDWRTQNKFHWYKHVIDEVPNDTMPDEHEDCDCEDEDVGIQV